MNFDIITIISMKKDIVVVLQLAKVFFNRNVNAHLKIERYCISDNMSTISMRLLF